MTIQTRHVHPVNPLEELCAEAQRLCHSPVHKLASNQLGKSGRALVTIVSAPGNRLADALAALASTAAPSDLAVANVLLFAVMLRFSELLQQARETLGYKRQWTSYSPDLLAAIHQQVVDRDDARLVELISREVRAFSPFLDGDSVKAAVVGRLADFRRIDMESHIRPPANSSLYATDSPNRLTASASPILDRDTGRSTLHGKVFEQLG